MRISLWIRLVLAATLFVLVATAGAQEPARWVPDGSPFLIVPDTVPAPGVRAAQPAAPKSVGTALTISLVTTYIPLGVALATNSSGAALVSSIGVLIGPSTGYWYAGSDKWKGGLVFRLIMTGVGTGGALLASQCVLEETNGGCTAGEVIMVLAATGIVVDGVVDIAKLPNAVRAENAARLSVSPTVGLDGRSAGLNARWRF
jgi:hypothetical protein